MPEQWCPFAVRHIGVQGLKAKNGYPGGVQGVPSDYLMSAAKRGEVKHDSTGPLAATFRVLDLHPINSWHFTVDDTGIYQHYPVDANCWHGNDTDPDQDVRTNIELVGVEHTRAADNVIGTPRRLSSIQTMLSAELTRWLADNAKRPHLIRYAANVKARDDQWLLCEHNEVGNDPTACPSNRIPWAELITLAEDATEEGDDVFKRQIDEASGLEFLYLYNGPTPIRRFGSTERSSDGTDERSGREALNFGGNWLWRRYFTDTGVFDAAGYLSEVEGD